MYENKIFEAEESAKRNAKIDRPAALRALKRRNLYAKKLRELTSSSAVNSALGMEKDVITEEIPNQEELAAEIAEAIEAAKNNAGDKDWEQLEIELSRLEREISPEEEMECHRQHEADIVELDEWSSWSFLIFCIFAFI